MSTRGSGIRHVIPPAMQADATLSQANPVSGTKYTVLDTTKNARIITAVASVTWTVQPTPLEIHVTIDGNAYTFAFTNPVSAAYYKVFLYFTNTPADQILALYGGSPTEHDKMFLLEGRSVKIEAETTGGTVQALDARVKYAKW